MWQVLIVACCAFTFYSVKLPFLYVYQKNNEHRSYAVAKAKEVAYKKKMRELEAAEEGEEAAEE